MDHVTATAPIAGRLGPYEIIDLLGAGGMGEVYRARDPRLRRDVAIKVLPAAVADDEDRLKRLQREARAVSQINHPNIVAIYDIGSNGAIHYVVMELLEGKTLAACMETGPLPQRKVLDYAMQIARGLTAAHDKQIVHRDLKPANIFVTKDGRVKVLDFGLARRMPSIASPDRSSTLTEPGMVLGTPAYMSPEQARGLPIDHRSDLFSLGIILYELLCGANPFEAASQLETMMNIIKREPRNIAEIVPNLPAFIGRIVHHCLEKAPEERFQTANDLVFDLENCSQTATVAIPSMLAPPGKTWTRRAALAALATLTMVAGGILIDRSVRLPEPSAPTFRRITFRRGIVEAARFTADGRTIVYSAGWDGSPLQLHLLRIERPESQSLESSHANLSAVAPDGTMAVILNQKLLDWTDGGTLAEMPLLGGPHREILDGVIHADWSPTGELAVLRRTERGMQLEYPIGRVLDRYTDQMVVGMRVSPKGDQIAVHSIGIGSVTGELSLITMDGKKRTLAKNLVSAPGLAWTPDGQEIWYSAGAPGDYSAGPAVFAVTLAGKQRLLCRMPGWLWLHDISREGVALVSLNTWQTGMIVGERDLAWLDWSILADIASDGKQVLFTEGRDGVANTPTIYVRSTDGLPAVRLGEGVALAFSNDGKSVLGLRASARGRKVVLLPLQAGQTEVLHNELDCLWAGWLPDGRIILSARTPRGPQMFVQARGAKSPSPLTPPGMAIGLVDSEGAGGIRPVSPDGRWVVVYDQQQHGWLYPIQGGSPHPLAGMLPDDQPAGWSPDGNRFYVYQAREVPIRIDSIDATTGARTLFKEITIPDPAGIYKLGTIILMPDGQSFARGYKRTLSTLYTVKGLR